MGWCSENVQLLPHPPFDFEKISKWDRCPPLGPKVPPSAHAWRHVCESRRASLRESHTGGGTICRFREVPFSKGLAQLTAGPSSARPLSRLFSLTCVPVIAHVSPRTYRPSIVRLRVDSTEAHGAHALLVKFPPYITDYCV